MGDGQGPTQIPPSVPKYFKIVLLQYKWKDLRPQFDGPKCKVEM